METSLTLFIDKARIDKEMHEQKGGTQVSNILRELD